MKNRHMTSDLIPSIVAIIYLLYQYPLKVVIQMCTQGPEHAFCVSLLLVVMQKASL